MRIMYDTKKSIHLIIVIFNTVVIMILIGCAATKSYAYEKIGFFDLQYIFQNSEIGKKKANEFKNIYDEEKAKIADAEKDLRTRKDYLAENKSLLTPEIIKKLESDYQKKIKEYQELVNCTNEDLKKKDQELIKSLLPPIIKIIQKVEKQEGYTAIVDKTLMEDTHSKKWSNMSYSRDKDISDRIIAELNKDTISSSLSTLPTALPLPTESAAPF